MPVLHARRAVQLVADAGSQPSDLLVQRFPIALDGLAADVLAGYEYVIVVADRVEIRRGAEAGDVLIRFEVGVLAAPGVVGIGDAADVFGGQLALARDTMCPSARASMNSTSLNRAPRALTPGPIRRALPTMTPLCSCTTQGECSWYPARPRSL
jgi:hypothetical protein